ncbi:MAG TPA: transglutaminase domain-containing protein [Candidatus Dormibacteraeota bacterium]|nr:transglutaminase domain-containing protein [Candidatus Dormibacteraeota bacterium]
MSGTLFWFVLLPGALVAAAAARSAGILNLVREEAGLDLQLRRGRTLPARWHVHVDLEEGWLTYLILLWLGILTAATVSASHWVPRSDALVPLVLAGGVVSLVLAKLAPRGTTYWLAIEASGVGAIFLATREPGDGAWLAAFPGWITAISHSLELAVLVCMGGMAWLAVGWTTFWIARRHNFTVAVAPMAVVLAVEVINDPLQSDLYLRVGAWIVLAALFSLRLNVVRLIRRWRDAGNEQLAWTVSVEGGRALAVIVTLAFVLPPLSTVDLSTRLFLNQGRSQISAGTGPGAGGSPLNQLLTTGYTEQVAPGGTLRRSQNPVLEVKANTTGTIYWRGIALYHEQGGVWDASDGLASTADYNAGDLLESSPGRVRTAVTAQFRVVGEPQRTVFSAGEPQSAAIPVIARVVPSGATHGLGLDAGTVDGLYAHSTMGVNTTYSVTATMSAATEDQLRAAGRLYPAFVSAIMSANPADRVDPRVRAVALRVSAAATNPYDQVKAIETYLRGADFHYQLDIQAPPASADPVLYFLLTSRTGYCEYFASSMGEMVRSLGLPVRLINGYGMGTQGDKPGSIGTFTVKAADAHTWVEVYFPTYGWVPFEPTPDPAYPALAHGAQPTATATPDTSLPTPRAPVDPGAGGANPHPKTPVGGALPVDLRPVLGGLLALALAGLALAAVRGSAAPADVGGPWRRLGWIARRVGVARAPAETPLEYTGRLASALPRFDRDIEALGLAYSRARYSRAGLAEGELDSMRQAWSRLRGALLLALLLGRRHGALGGPPGLPAMTLPGG